MPREQTPFSSSGESVPIENQSVSTLVEALKLSFFELHTAGYSFSRWRYNRARCNDALFMPE